jgi:beta-carotene hydroxylase
MSIRKNDKPSLQTLGEDLLKLSRFNLFMTIFQPIICFGLFFVFAFKEYYLLAFICTLGLSFTTYGSTSHDLVHMNLKLPVWVNEFLLFFFELICLRSGHAYRLSHLNHHRRFPNDDDIEGAAAKMNIFRTFIEGIIFQIKICIWAFKNHKKKSDLYWIITEVILVLIIILFALYSINFTYVFLAYTILMIMGSWIIPFVTSYVVHLPEGKDELHQTKLFRGKFFSVIALDHLYHLEHHMYPMVPHKNWPILAKRLDLFFEKNNINPVKIGKL